MRALGATWAALLLSACTSPPPRIAIVGSTVALAGARLAVEDVNRTGGIDGRPLQLTERSDNGRPQASVTIAQQLADDPAVLGVVGHNGSASSLAASQVYNAAGLVQVAATTTAPLFARAGRFSFTLVPSDVRQAAFIARQLHAWNASRIVVVHGNDDYGRGLRAELRACLGRTGPRPLLEYALDAPASASELGLLPSVIVRARPDALVWIGQPWALGDVLPELEAALPGLRVLGSDAFDDSYTYGEGSRVLKGLRFVRFLDPLAGGQRVQSLAARFYAVTGRQLTYEPAFTYDAVLLLAEALRRGAGTRLAVQRQVAAIARGGFDGAAGRLELDGQAPDDRRYLLGEVTPQGVRAVPVP